MFERSARRDLHIASVSGNGTVANDLGIVYRVGRKQFSSLGLIDPRKEGECTITTQWNSPKTQRWMTESATHSLSFSEGSARRSLAVRWYHESVALETPEPLEGPLRRLSRGLLGHLDQDASQAQL